MTNTIKISIASVVAVFILGGFAFAKLPDRQQKLVKFHEALITESQKEWEELDMEQKSYEGRINELVAEKKQIEEEANIFRETISVLKNEPLGVDFTQPEN